MSQWLHIIVCYVESVVVNHVCYAKKMVVSHGEFSQPVVVINLHGLLRKLL